MFCHHLGRPQQLSSILALNSAAARHVEYPHYQTARALVVSKVEDLAISTYAPPRSLSSNFKTNVLQAAINQLAFGANPSVSGAGGPGGACGICYRITPVSASGTALSANALTFKIIDECPASVALSGGKHCDTCSTSEVRPPLHCCDWIRAF